MKKICFVLVAMSLLLSCNKTDDPKDDPSAKDATAVRLSTSVLSFDAIGAESQTIKVYADGKWEAEGPEWVNLDPASGNGTVTVTVTVTDNENIDGRVGEVVFGTHLASSTTNKATIQQKGDNKVTIKTGQELVDWLAKLNAESLDEAALGADIDMTGVQFVSAEAFSGVLDGKGHAIKNLTATGPLFKVNKGELKNIVIDESCSFEPDSTVFGTIVARNEGIINDCTNKADVVRKISKNASPSNHMRSNLIAGIAGMSTREETISNCKNYGDISIIVTDNGGFTTNGVAGVIALTAGSLSNCENHGDIKLEGGWHVGRACPARLGTDGNPDPDGEITQGEIYTTKISSSVGGVVGYIVGELSDCLNTGNVSWIENQVEKINTSPARMFAGGVAGSYFGKVTNCTNEGVFTVKAIASDGSEVTSQNHQLCVGAVLGAFNNPANDAHSKCKGTEVRNCVNKGKVIMDAYTSKSQIHLGGIVGYPSGPNEIAQGTMYDCSNTGDIEISGKSKFRAGGVAGVPSNMEGCTNKNTITIHGGHSDSCAGGLLGGHWGVTQLIKNCSSEAAITSEATIDLGGLVGDISNQASDTNKEKGNVSATFEGCTVKGSISQTGGIVGMLVGWCAGESVKVTMGSSATPIEVSGSVNGTTLVQSSPFSLFWGTGFESSVHSVNYVVK
ncbi:MAG: hypothetical protein MJY57_00095 [Bacteroidales bacterium]|nr:hypothetical protein [Bacteroidales bacterium]